MTGKMAGQRKKIMLSFVDSHFFVVTLHPHLRNSADERCCPTNKFNTYHKQLCT